MKYALFYTLLICLSVNLIIFGFTAKIISSYNFKTFRQPSIKISSIFSSPCSSSRSTTPTPMVSSTTNPKPFINGSGDPPHFQIGKFTLAAKLNSNKSEGCLELYGGQQQSSNSSADTPTNGQPMEINVWLVYQILRKIFVL